MNDVFLCAILAIWIPIAGFTLAICIAPHYLENLLVKPEEDLDNES